MEIFQNMELRCKGLEVDGLVRNDGPVATRPADAWEDHIIHYLLTKR